ncbi:glycerol-3-phosphate 1-O-acyltransferase PlsY [Xanthobacter sp. AM11]|uniref:glycerol-3-phosphate 1-O-acyltransferase PlsY n=1 Tax=Xanthobacter sp. AM11 TaxID=3380643 RepID=UPI0039BF2DB7
MPDAPSSALVLLLALAFGYLLGSIPFGLLLTRAAGTRDLRSIGSGNIGATNVLRTGRKDLAAATLLLDALKGTVPVLAAAALAGPQAAMAAGLGAFLGHIFPVWLRFNGGKGVATFIGVTLGLAWPGVAAFAVVWLAAAYVTRYSSLAALMASVATVAMVAATGDDKVAMLLAVLAILLWVKHHANIRRLLDGTEGKIGAKG